MIGGTKGSLSIPHLRIWQHEDDGLWKQPISATSFSRPNVDPLVAQVIHFRNVINGGEEPLVSGEEGMRSLQMIEAMRQSALDAAVDLAPDRR